MESKHSVYLEKFKHELTKVLTNTNNSLDHLKKFKTFVSETDKNELRNGTVENMQKAIEKVENYLINSQEELLELYVKLEFDDKTPDLIESNDDFEFEENNQINATNTNKVNVATKSNNKNRDIEILEEELQRIKEESQKETKNPENKIENDEQKDDEREIDEIIEQLEESVYEQMENHKAKIEKVENIQQVVANMEMYFEEKMKNNKICSERIKKMIIMQEERLKEIKKDMKNKDEMLNRGQKELVDEFFDKLREILSKLDLDSDVTLTHPYNHRMYSIRYARKIGQISSRIDLRNELIERLKQELRVKEETMNVQQEKYCKLLYKIKLVIIALTDAKMASLGLESEIEKLKITLKSELKIFDNEDDDIDQSTMKEFLKCSQDSNKKDSPKETKLDYARQHESNANGSLNKTNQDNAAYVNARCESKSRERQEREQDKEEIKNEFQRRLNDEMDQICQAAQGKTVTQQQARHDQQLKNGTDIILNQQQKVKDDNQKEMDAIFNKFERITKKIRTELPETEKMITLLKERYDLRLKKESDEIDNQEKTIHIGFHDTEEEEGKIRNNDHHEKDAQENILEQLHEENNVKLATDTKEIGNDRHKKDTQEEILDIQQGNAKLTTADTEGIVNQFETISAHLITLRSELRQIRKNYVKERKGMMQRGKSPKMNQVGIRMKPSVQRYSSVGSRVQINYHNRYH